MASTARPTLPAAIVDGTTLERAGALGLSWAVALERNERIHFFAALGDLIVWGPTGTNVGDVHVVLVGLTLSRIQRLCSELAG